MQQLANARNYTTVVSNLMCLSHTPCYIPHVCFHSFLRWGLYTYALLCFIRARTPFDFSQISFLLFIVSPYLPLLAQRLGVMHLRDATTNSGLILRTQGGSTSARSP